MRKILVIRLSAFGDVAMLLPVVKAAAEAYPEDEFVVLTRKNFLPLYQGICKNISTKVFDDKCSHKGVCGLWRLGKELRQMGITHVADMHNVLRSKFLRMLLFFLPSAFIEKGRKEKKQFISTKKQTYPLKHTTMRYTEVFRRLGVCFTLYPNKITYPLGVLPAQWEEYSSSKPRIGIAPFARYATKTYPEAHMLMLIEELSKDKNRQVFLFGGGKKEEETLQRWAEGYTNVFVVAGKLSLVSELSLLSTLDVCVTMDSANMHLASLVKTPVVSVWGATHPFLGFYGMGQSMHNVVQTAIPLTCRPCSVFGGKPCSLSAENRYLCLSSIPPKDILEKVLHVLKYKEK